MLTIEAQNALLKTLEEPPPGTVLIMTTSHDQALLPTIRSRVQTLTVLSPESSEIISHFSGMIGEAELQQLLLISNGLPGLLASLVAADSLHPLQEAVGMARLILQSAAYERLLLVDELIKRKDLCRDVCFILSQMAEAALLRIDAVGFRRWQQILTVSHQAQQQLLASAQAKLVLTNLMLAI